MALSQTLSLKAVSQNALLPRVKQTMLHMELLQMETFVLKFAIMQLLQSMHLLEQECVFHPVQRVTTLTKKTLTMERELSTCVKHSVPLL